jgi:hypothetical protein
MTAFVTASVRHDATCRNDNNDADDADDDDDDLAVDGVV